MYSIIIFIIFLNAIATEALTELLVKSTIFLPIRDFFDKKSRDNVIYEFLSNLLFCGYCTSVWVSFLLMIPTFLFTDFILINKFIDFLLFILVIHRLSNVFHYLIDYIGNLKEFKRTRDL
jgi:hypothetical protein